MSFSVFTGVILRPYLAKVHSVLTGESWQFESIPSFPQTESILILSNYFGSAVSIFQAATLPKILVSAVQNVLPKKVKAKSTAR